MPASVIVIGLDAAEATLLNQWASEGYLKNLAHLMSGGCVCRLKNSLETLPGAIWPEITSGRSCGKVPLYFHPRQLRTGEARIRPILAEEVDPEDYYWTLASRAGRRVAVVDQPQTVPAPNLNGIQLFEWGLHDRNFRTASDPPELLEELCGRYGDHPVARCDLYGRRQRGYEQLLESLLEGVERKNALLLDVLSRDHWDLFAAVYGETHCVGHQFWHFLDSRHRWHDPHAPAHLRNAILSVYRRVDEGLGRLVEAAGSGAFVLVVASHGMGPYTGGPQLLPEVLVRLGMGSGRRSGGSSWLRRLQTKVSHSPRIVQPLLRRLADTSLVKRWQTGAGCLLDPLESPSTLAASLRNNRCGAIRLNLRGREPFGQVDPGSEAEELISALRQELLALRHPANGALIVKRVVTAAEAFGSGYHPDVPDLMVVFRTDLGPLEACHSPRVGLVKVPLFHPNIPRSGDHTVESRLWIMGPGFPSGTRLPDANVLDIAPTVLRLLDLPLPDLLDGAPLSVLDISRRNRKSVGLRGSP